MSAPRRRRRSTPGADLRTALTESLRTKAERYRDRVGPFVSPWPRLLDQLEAGEPVEVPAYLLPVDVRVEHGGSGLVLVDADGTVSAVES